MLHEITNNILNVYFIDFIINNFVDLLVSIRLPTGKFKSVLSI